ncbi:hypothetical protein O3M35_004737 [Rhynocoris fuscipes]|uniref:G-protein coupled receptors family 1 profile domain-containing protein n=1 Tax=Rhynocoris fuscipes TaxID=488301 RepID=A0AAW1DFZ5_9HEMI
MFKSGWNCSYLLGYDHREDANMTYYFTFYSEFGERRIESYLEAVILIVTLIASLVFNLALVIPLINSKPRTVTNCFLLNLGLADILFAVGIPAVVTVRIDPNWPRFAGDFICRVLPYSQLVCGFTILWSLTLISVERYRCLSLDRNFKISSPTSANLANILMWSSAMVLFAPFLFWFRHESELEICTLVFPKPATINVALLFTILIIFFTCFLPITILMFNYQRIFVKMVESRQRWATPCVHTSSLSRQEQARVNKQIRVMRIALANVAVVLLMWLPITVVLSLIYIDGDRPIEDTEFFLRSYHFLGALSIALLNTAVNPFLTTKLSIKKCLQFNVNDRNTSSGSSVFKIGTSHKSGSFN